MVKVFQKEIKVKTKGLYDFVKITEELEKCVNESKVKNGMLFANLLHNTAALLIQEDDSSIFEDLKEMFERFLPMKGKYHHSYEGNVNATAHQKNNLLKSFFTVPIKNGKLVKGTWQEFWVIELFEPRERKVFVTIIGE